MSERPERWTQATVHPDMWVDPDADPRNTDGVSADGELATLQDYLRDYRLTLLMKCEGLNAEQLARRSVPPSTLSLLGLLRHLARAERHWRGWIAGDPLPTLYGARDADVDGAVAEQAVADAAHADLAREQAATTPHWLGRVWWISTCARHRPDTWRDGREPEDRTFQSRVSSISVRRAPVEGSSVAAEDGPPGMA